MRRPRRARARGSREAQARQRPAANASRSPRPARTAAARPARARTASRGSRTRRARRRRSAGSSRRAKPAGRCARAASHARAACSVSCSISSAMRSTPSPASRSASSRYAALSLRASGYARASQRGGRHDIEPAIATSRPLACARLARRRDRAFDHFYRALAEPCRLEHEARGRERIRADHVGARGDVVGLNRAQQLEFRERRGRAPCKSDRARSRAGAARCRCRRRVAARVPRLACRARCRSLRHGSRSARGAATRRFDACYAEVSYALSSTRWKGGPSMRTTHSTRRAWVLLPLAVALVVFVPAFGAKKSADYWVATWTTALVIRPVGPPAGPPAAGGPPPAVANGPPRRPMGRRPLGGAPAARRDRRLPRRCRTRRCARSCTRASAATKSAWS